MATSPEMNARPDPEGASGTGLAHRPSHLSRIMAITAFVAGALLVLLIVGFLVRNGVYVVVGLAGAALGIAGGWWVITERSLRRRIGYAALVVGAALMVVALLRAGQESWASVVRLVLASAAPRYCDHLCPRVTCCSTSRINQQRHSAGAPTGPSRALVQPVVWGWEGGALRPRRSRNLPRRGEGHPPP